MRAGRGRTAAIAAAAAIATSSQSNRKSHTPTSVAAATTVTTSTGLPSNANTAAASSGNKNKQISPRLEKVNKNDECNKKNIDENEKIIKTSSRSSTIAVTTATKTTTAVSSSAAALTTATTNLSSSKKNFETLTSTPTSTSPTIQFPSSSKRGRKQTLTPAIEHEKMHVDEDLSDYNLVTARARRTPKPNPKYAREDIVTSYVKSMKGVKSDEESEQGDFVDSADDFEIHSGDIKDEDIGETDEELEENVRRRHKLVSKLRARSTMQQRSSNTEFLSPGNKRKFEDSATRRESFKPYNKHVKIDMYDASDSDVSIPSPNTSQRILKNVVKSTGSLSSNRQTSLLRPLLKSMQNEMPKSKPIQILERRKDSNTTLSSSKSSLSSSSATVKRALPAIRRNEDDDVQIATTGTASTVDDFETMPTFTIVNINDIINKKNDDILKLDTVNRRGKTHTLISQKAEVSPPRSPFPVRKGGIILNNNTTKSYLKSSGGDNINTSSAPPRILNSVVGRKTRPVSPIVRTTKDVKKLPVVSTSPPTQTLPYIKRNLKENVSSSSPIPRTTTPTPKPTTITNRSSIPSSNNNNNNNNNNNSGGKGGGIQLKTVTRKLPNDRVFVQKQGNKLVKKMTCFETWYVINLPPQANATSDKQQRKTASEDNCNYVLDMSLVELGNRIKEVQLPNSWNYKVTLQKLSPAQMNRSDLELYVGDLNDPTVSDEDKIKYHPVNIMFRRINKIKTRIPYDRSVTFKNNECFLNIDGKHIRLCNGAPTVIKSIDDISILLEILNDLTLNSEFVEQLNLNIL